MRSATRFSPGSRRPSGRVAATAPGESSRRERSGGGQPAPSPESIAAVAYPCSEANARSPPTAASAERSRAAVALRPATRGRGAAAGTIVEMASLISGRLCCQAMSRGRPDRPCGQVRHSGHVVTFARDFDLTLCNCSTQRGPLPTGNRGAGSAAGAPTPSRARVGAKPPLLSARLPAIPSLIASGRTAGHASSSGRHGAITRASSPQSATRLPR
jgi:hypothetical protein